MSHTPPTFEMLPFFPDMLARIADGINIYTFAVIDNYN